MLDGIFSSQLPFMLLSSGVSALLYIIYSFTGTAATEAEDVKLDSEHQIVVQESVADQADQHQKTLHFKDYTSSQKTLQLKAFHADVQPDDKPVKYLIIDISRQSLLFAGKSFSRPPPALA